MPNTIPEAAFDSTQVDRDCAPHPLALMFGRLAVGPKRWPLMGVWQRRLAQRAINAGAEYFCIDTCDGEQLAGLYLPPAKVEHKCLPIILAHGWIECKELHLGWAMKLAAQGHPVMMYDHRGHGSSTGQHVTFGLRECDDVQSVIETGMQRGWIDDQVITAGYSLGSSAVLHHAVDHPQVAGVVAVAPFYDLPRAVESFRLRRLRVLSPQWVHGGFGAAAKLAGFSLEQVSSAKAVEKLETPVMFVIAGRDALVPAKAHAWPLTRLKNKGRKVVVEVPAAGHVSIVRRSWPQLDKHLVSYCRAISAGDLR